MLDGATSHKRVLIPVLVGVICLALGFGAGAGYEAWAQPDAVASFDGRGEIRGHGKNFKFISPLLECDLGQTYIGQTKAKPSRLKLERLISEAKSRGDATFVSIYYRDLNNGPWLGINEREEFTPASLLKVPFMLYHLKKGENDPSYLLQSVAFSGTPPQGAEPHYPPERTLDISTPHRIEELIEQMIVYSDNNAASALMELAGEDPLSDLFQTLNIELSPDSTDDFLTVKDYAAFFRVLFNSSYLNNQMSERALELLSRTTFNKALTAKLPQELPVAHKFGERFHFLTKEKQLHDCGIIYYPEAPYLLCVMTRGEDFDRLAETISDISKAVYDDVRNKLTESSSVIQVAHQ